MGFEPWIVQTHNLVIIPTKLSQILVQCGYKEITKSTSLGLDSRSFQGDRRQVNEKEGECSAYPHIAD
jgi:hypothetical protein